MAFDLAALRDGVKTRLATIDGLSTYDTIPDRDLAVPAAVVQPAQIRYQEAFKKGLVEVRMRVTILTSASSDRVGQDQLDGYLSAGTGQSASIVDAIEADPTLDGAADSSAVDVDFDIDYGRTVVNEAAYWKADLQLKILRARS